MYASCSAGDFTIARINLFGRRRPDRKSHATRFEVLLNRALLYLCAKESVYYVINTQLSMSLRSARKKKKKTLIFIYIYALAISLQSILSDI